MGIENNTINGIVNGAIKINMLNNNINATPNISNKVFEIINSDIKFNKQKIQERKSDKIEIKNNRYNISKEIINKSSMNHNQQCLYLSLISYMDEYGLYIYDVNNPFDTYQKIEHNYLNEYYRYHGKYRCVAWSGDILTETEIESLKIEKINLEKEINKLEKQFKENIKIYNTLLHNEFTDINFNNYSKHIKKQILKYLSTPELKSYIEDKTKETIYDILHCQQQIEDCIFEIDKIIENNQINIEKKLSFKIKKLFFNR